MNQLQNPELDCHDGIAETEFPFQCLACELALDQVQEVVEAFANVRCASAVFPVVAAAFVAFAGVAVAFDVVETDVVVAVDAVVDCGVAAFDDDELVW